MDGGRWYGKGARTMRRLENVINPIRLHRPLDALSILYVVELELTRDGDGYLLRAEVTRVRDVHLAIVHFELQPHRVVVAEDPNGSHDADVVVSVGHGLALADDGYAAVLAGFDHFDVVGVLVCGDLLGEFYGGAAAGCKISYTLVECTKSWWVCFWGENMKLVAYTSQRIAAFRNACFSNCSF